MSRSPGMKM